MTVILPAYRQAGYLPAAIDSSLSQHCGDADVDVIVVDDGSPDETAAVCRNYGDRIRYVRKENAGVSAARNTGILASSGDWLQFLDADDLLPPGMIAAHMHRVQERPDADVLYCGSYGLGPEGERIGPDRDYGLPEEPGACFRQLLLGNNFPPHAAIVRRRALENAGLWDTQIHYFEDWDLWLRLAFSGAKFVKTPGVYVGYRHHPGSATKNIARMRHGAKQVLDRAAIYAPRDRATRRALANGRWNMRRHFLRQLREAKELAPSGGKEASGDIRRSRSEIFGEALRDDPMLAMTWPRDWARRLRHRLAPRATRPATEAGEAAVAEPAS